MFKNSITFYGKPKSKVNFSNMTVKSSSTEEMLKEIVPFDWSEDVLSGKSGVEISIKWKERLMKKRR